MSAVLANSFMTRYLPRPECGALLPCFPDEVVVFCGKVLFQEVPEVAAFPDFVAAGGFGDASVPPV